MTGVLGRGRAVFAATAVVFAALLAVTVPRLPPLVASHFDVAGAPDTYTARDRYAALMIGLGILLPIGTVALVVAITRSGPRHLNLPAQEYWRRPEHGPEAVRRARAYMWWLAAVLTAGTGAVHLAVLSAHRAEPPSLDTEGILLVIAVFLAGIGAWAVGWYRVFRP